MALRGDHRECYIPLLRMCDRLAADGVRFKLTVSLSPPLMAMLSDDLLRQRYRDYLEQLTQLADKEILRHHGSPEFLELARMYRRIFHETAVAFDEHYGRDLVGAFRRLQDAGVLEVITTAATHGFLPLLRGQPGAVRAQIMTAVDTYAHHFGKPPEGLWLPECAYYAELEDILADAGIRYFFVDTHGALNASERPRRGVMAPIACANGVAAFGRDPDSSRQVWSASEGYPGDPECREFYRDVGFDLDPAELRPFLPDGVDRAFTGIKYCRITGGTDQKEPYRPAAAQARADAHAADFMQRAMDAVSRHATTAADRPPQIVALYDAELFGHWWFEGPLWLDLLIRKLAFDQDQVELISPGDYLRRHPNIQCAQPSPSTWGDQGYSTYWLDPGNDWIYRHVHEAGQRMHGLATAHADVAAGSLLHRALQQAARSLLLAQASDWAFIMKTGTAVDYAYDRIRDHMARFHHLADAIDSGRIDERELAALEVMDPIFPQIDYRVYASQ